MNPMTILLAAWAATALLMFVLWLRQIQSSNAGIVDVAWALLTPIVGSWLILADDAANGTRQYLVICLCLFWGLRLAFYLFKRSQRETEDGRYRHMREYCGRYAQPAMFVFFQLQALAVLMFALPFWGAARNVELTLGLLDYAGVVVWLIAFFGEWLSDWQLAKFKRSARGSSAVCQEGLWKYSRHPNYFFECLHWWAYVLIGYGSDYWILTWAGLLAMYVSITRVTGVPYVEQQSLRSKGEAYRRYQQSTSAFFPMPPRVAVSKGKSGRTRQRSIQA